jgi:hypothetical protein
MSNAPEPQLEQLAEETVPTPYGDGRITEVRGSAQLSFTGPMARDALDWALASGKGERRQYAEEIATLVQPAWPVIV